MKKPLLMLILLTVVVKAQVNKLASNKPDTTAQDLTNSVPPVKTNAPLVDDKVIFTAVEQEPEFPGKFNDYIKANLKYPQGEVITGRVIAQFVVEKDGSLSNIKILRGINDFADKEAISLLLSSPKWRSGMQNGKPVRVYYTIVIHFGDY